MWPDGSEAEMNRSDAGFTLIEVLIALALTATIFGMLYGTYAATDESVGRCRERMARQQQARALAALIAREARCAHLSPDEDEGPSTSGEQEGPLLPREERLSLAQELAGEPGHALVLTTAGGIPEAHELSYGLDAVAYRLDAEGGTLYRRQAPAVYTPDQRRRPAAWHVVARGVHALTLDAFDGEQWHGGWAGGGEEPNYPRAVRVTVAMGESARSAVTYSTVVYTGWRERQDEEEGAPLRAVAEGSP